MPPATALVDAAIDLFSSLVLEQPLKIQESAFAQLATCISESSVSKNSIGKLAVTANIVTAISKAIPTVAHRAAKCLGQNKRVMTLILDVLQVCTLYLRC
jgi:HEAT repeat-containing protein 5